MVLWVWFSGKLVKRLWKNKRNKRKECYIAWHIITKNQINNVLNQQIVKYKDKYCSCNAWYMCM